MRAALLLLLTTLAGCFGGPAEEPAAAAVSIDIVWSPDAPAPGQLTLFRAAVSSNQPGDRIESIAWEIGNIPYVGNEIEHRFHRAGEFSVRVEVTTEQVGATVAQETIQVLPAGAPRPDPAPGPPSTPPPVTPDSPLAILSTVHDATVAFSFQWGEEATQVHWDFGDGATSKEFAVLHTYAAAGSYLVTLRAVSDQSITEATSLVTVEAGDAEPYVVVGVVDSGINPYHEIYYRPDLTEHPCTYVADYPCNVPALELTVGPDARSWSEAFAADADEWKKATEGKWFWIPRTNLIAVGCTSLWDAASGDQCILDDSSMHGTGTTSSALMENPDALIAFVESSLVSGVTAFHDRGIPVDVLSLSLGFGGVPFIGLPAAPLPGGSCSILLDLPDDQIIVQSSGNEPGLSILADCWSGDPRLITVGGASAARDGQEAMAYKDMDVVSYFCRPTAQTQSLGGQRASYCGTSFSAPTVAGAVSKVILELRRASGHLGGTEGPYVDPILRVSKAELRDALNLTASYDPEAQYPNSCSAAGAGVCVPKNAAAPWTQWGWGFYDGTVAEATTDHLLGIPQPPKPAAAVAHQEALYTARVALYG